MQTIDFDKHGSKIYLLPAGQKLGQIKEANKGGGNKTKQGQLKLNSEDPDEDTAEPVAAAKAAPTTKVPAKNESATADANTTKADFYNATASNSTKKAPLSDR